MPDYPVVLADNTGCDDEKYARPRADGTLVQNPSQQIMAGRKQETDSKNAETMTPEQYQELAARYNGGPYWQSSDAQGYGRAFTGKLPQARQALGS